MRMTFTCELNDDLIIQQPQLSPPDRDAHKYDRGHTLVFSGPPLATGASRLAARAALVIGSGVVTLVGDENELREQAAHVTSIMLHSRDEEMQSIDSRVTAFVIGPGYGVSAATARDVITIAEQGRAMALDADGLTSFENEPQRLFDAAHSQIVLTPHEGEFSRLFPDIEWSDHKSAAVAAAKLSGAVVLFKGEQTVIAAPDGRLAINTHANSWLATAGSGDVLTGMVSGIMAQGTGAFTAACAAVWMHGDIAFRHGAGLTAPRMIDLIPDVLADCLVKEDGK